MDKKNDHKQDEYDFYREVMKKKPLDKRKIAVSAAGVAAGAVLFGVIAAFVFVKSVPYFRPEEEQPRVNIVEGASTDVGEENTPQQEIPEEESGDAPTDENEATDTETQKEPLTLQEYSDLYQQISEAASEPKSSVVVVQGFTNDVDWMNNSFEDEKQASGYRTCSDQDFQK